MKNDAITKHAEMIPKIKELIDQPDSMKENASCAASIKEIKELIIRTERPDDMKESCAELIEKIKELIKLTKRLDARCDTLITQIQELLNGLDEMKSLYKTKLDKIKKKCEEIWNALNPLIKLIEDIKKIDVYTKFTELIKKTENINSKLSIVEGYKKYKYDWDYSALHFGMYLFLFLSRSKLIFNYSFRKRG